MELKSETTYPITKKDYCTIQTLLLAGKNSGPAKLADWDIIDAEILNNKSNSLIRHSGRRAGIHLEK